MLEAVCESRLWGRSRGAERMHYYLIATLRRQDIGINFPPDPVIGEIAAGSKQGHNCDAESMIPDTYTRWRLFYMYSIESLA